MFIRTRMRMLLLGFTLLAVSALFLLIFPGFNVEVPPPDTIGNDLVVTGADFSAGGDFVRTTVARAAAGDAAVSLEDGSPEGSFTSAVQQADFEFNALGLHWLADTPEGSALTAAVRFSSDGETWGEWIPINVEEDEGPDNIEETKSAGETIGQLAFADHARFFQYRFDFHSGASGAAPSLSRLTASYIDAKGYHESTLSLTAASRLARAMVSGPEEATAAPNVISRAQWGANEAYMTWSPDYVMPKKQIIHHTVTSNYDLDPAATVRAIYYYHAVSLGWGDIGYNFLVDRNGNIYEGRYGGNAVVGGHAQAWNYGSIGIALLGDYSSSDITTAGYWGLVNLLQWKSNADRIDPRGNDYMLGTYLPNYLGHRDVGATACPGDGLYQYLPMLRNAVVYSPVPIEEPIYGKWESLYGAPGGAVNTQYPISGGIAQDFIQGRIIWKQSSGLSYWVQGGILQKYESLGNTGSYLGWPASDEYGVSSGRAHDFEAGKIYWQAGTGAHSVIGAIMGRYVSGGGPAVWGFPVSDEYGVSGFSGYQESDFQLARIFWSAGTGTAAVYGAINQKFVSAGGTSTFGPAVADEQDIAGVPGGRESSFAGGKIYWTPATGAGGTYGAIHDKYQQTGGPGGYQGLPVSDEYAAGSGRGQNFQQAVITYSAGLGAHSTIGGIMSKYMARGGPAGYFGLAVTDEMDAPGASGGRESDFQNGRIYWSQAYGIHEVYGAILGKYVEQGASLSMGLPITDEYAIPGVSGGRECDFQYGRIFWHPSTGAHSVIGAILQNWYGMGGPAGYLGLPVSDEHDTPGASGGRVSEFQRGHIFWSATTGTHAVYGAILAKYLEYGSSASALGLPTSDEYGYGAGRRSDFLGGSIYWDAQNGTIVIINSETTVTSDSNFEVRDQGDGVMASLPAGTSVSIRYSGGTYSVYASNGFSYAGPSYIRITGSGIKQATSYHDVPPWNPSLDDNMFRGTIEVRYSPVSQKVWVINELPLELYLRGIAETSSGSPAEFLRAMSVSARDYALYHVNNGGKYYGSSQDIFHLKNSRNGNGDDQVYKGYGLEARFPDLTAAVDATTGQVVTFNGTLAITTYFSNSDGRTRSAQEVWGVDSWPWLQSVSDPDCNGMNLSGHGVGLSGYGALKRAERGDSYQTILGYYFTGTAVQAMDTNKNIRVAIQGL